MEVATRSIMPRVHTRIDALERKAAELEEPDERPAPTRRQLVLGAAGVLFLVVAFAQTCFHARAPHDASPEQNVLPTVR